jgi:hypothetical protein
MGRPRHALPSGRRELESAYRALLAEAASRRAETAQARLEVTRLLTLTEGLTALVTRLSGELSDARRALDRRPDEGRAEALAAQVADLRATVVLQQSLLSDLTRSVAEALRSPAPPAPAAPVPQIVPAAVAAPVVPSAPVAGEAPVSPSAHAERPAHPEPMAHPVDEPVVDAVPGSAAEPAPGAGPVEDETVLRLRLIRQAFER